MNNLGSGFKIVTIILSLFHAVLILVFLLSYTFGTINFTENGKAVDNESYQIFEILILIVISWLMSMIIVYFLKRYIVR